MAPVPEPLADLLYTYCDANAPELIDDLAEEIEHGKIPGEHVELIRSQLTDAIRAGSITREEFRKLTGASLSPETVVKRLRETYARLFPSGPVP